MEIELNSIEEAVEEIKAGKVVIVVDDENRENEGDFITAAANATTDVINFMATHGRGLICAPLTAKRCAALNLDLMVHKKSSIHETNFTVSVDLIGKGCTTGISVKDRSKTALALIDPLTQPEELARPGHLFPLKSVDGGVLRRAGHTEAAVDLALLAGFEPAGIIVEILNDDGTMARLPDLIKIATNFQLKIVSIKDLIAYRLRTEKIIHRETAIRLPTKYGIFSLITFIQVGNDNRHYALLKDDGGRGKPIAVKIQESPFDTGAFESERSGETVARDISTISQNGNGVVLYINHQNGEEYRVSAQILNELGITKIHLLTSNPIEQTALSAYGIDVEGTDLISNPEHIVQLSNVRIKSTAKY